MEGMVKFFGRLVLFVGVVMESGYAGLTQSSLVVPTGKISAPTCLPGQHILKKEILTGSADHMVCLWNLNGSLLGRMPHESSVSVVCGSPCGNYIYTASLDGKIYVWGRDCNKLYCKELGPKGFVTSMCCCGEVLYGVGSGKFFILSLETKEWFETKMAVNKGTFCSLCAFASPYGHYLCLGDSEGYVILEKVGGFTEGEGSTWCKKVVDSADTFPINSLCFSPDNKNILVSFGNTGRRDANGGFCLYNLNGDVVLHVRNNDPVSTACFCSDGKKILIVSGDSWHVWNTGEKRWEFSSQKCGVMGACSYGQFILTWHECGWIYLWDAETKDCLCKYKVHDKAIEDVCFISPVFDNDTIVKLIPYFRNLKQFCEDHFRL